MAATVEPRHVSLAPFIEPETADILEPSLQDTPLFYEVFADEPLQADLQAKETPTITEQTTKPENYISSVIIENTDIPENVSQTVSEIQTASDVQFQQDTLDELAHSTQTLPPEIFETVNESIAKAVEEVGRLQASRELGKDEPEQETQITELFTEIFESVGLSDIYSAVDIERFVKLLLSNKDQEIKNLDPVLKLINYSFSSLGTYEGRRYLLSNPHHLRAFKKSLHTALGRVTLLSPRVNQHHQMAIAA